jgi:hypothetical protein
VQRNSSSSRSFGLVSAKGVRAIVVYPMDALANSQRNELEKFLGRDRPKVTVGRYTGQESRSAGHQVLAPVRRQRRQAQRVQAPDKAVDHVVGDIQNGQRTPRRHHRKTSRCGGGGVRKTRMAWTADRDRAEWFQHRYEHTDKPGKLWTITVGPDRLLAHYHERHRGEDEHVIDPSSRLRIDF